MLALADSLHADGVVVVGRSNNINDIAGIHQFACIGISSYSVGLRYFFCLSIIGVEKAYQLNAFNFLPVIQVKLTQMPNAKNANFQHVYGLIHKYNHLGYRDAGFWLLKSGCGLLIGYGLLLIIYC